MYYEKTTCKKQAILQVGFFLLFFVFLIFLLLRAFLVCGFPSRLLQLLALSLTTLWGILRALLGFLLSWLLGTRTLALSLRCPWLHTAARAGLGTRVAGLIVRLHHPRLCLG